ncbi:structural maintenance of chromosomes flexible hinge domain-containing protein 1-like isoform X2 [Ornithodoros turicata]|uniref:structural maintenance of chromosomes flexible hinge domain-containing protein 1-like isoform X2 n=1 Tax=Ornithodoros turicata TaxID=34597 RepID=UPI003139499F
MAAATKQFFVYDRRKTSAPQSSITLKKNATYLDLRTAITKQFAIPTSESFLVCTTNREEIGAESFGHLDGGETLYVLKSIDQELTGQTFEKVEYLPHYDTIIKSGMYEYYASEGQNPLPYAFAELIDNSLAATKCNKGSRKIELKLYLDDSSSQQDRSTIFVIDNGCGMTSWQLNNWAIYRLSKFTRKEKSLHPIDPDSSFDESQKRCPRFLNSEISYFGAGGKQAIFFIGNSTRMITKPKESRDVHELVISKDEFEQREKQKDFIYRGNILNRKLGDHSHVPAEDEGLCKIIADETGKEQFTCVAIWGISAEHVQFLKHNFNIWCTQLAHIYHYYLHGPDGNTQQDAETRAPSPYKYIDIEVSLLMKSGHHKVTNLRDIELDLETQLIRSTASTFEFRATVDGTREVEGVLRYHPFLYDHETFPVEINNDLKSLQDGEDEEDINSHLGSNLKPARGQRPIFECFWNGRLIPYTTIEEFEWCGTPKKMVRNVPLECFNRVSGVLWTGDAFQVSTNKLTFMDLENKLRDKNNTIFARVSNGQVQRGSIEKLFVEWLQTCHEQCDKQVRFVDFVDTVTRKDKPKYKQFPWAVYRSIEWDGKRFKEGQLIRTQRTNPVVMGTIRKFYLYGDHTDSVYATGGEFEISQEPRSMYDEVKSFALDKMDRKLTGAALQKLMDEEEIRLPAKLLVTWPEGDQLFPNEKRPAGKAIGDVKVEILNTKGESVSKLPGPQNKRLSVELKITWHSPSGDQVVAQYVSPHNKNWGYWFRKMENVQNLGAHTMTLQAMLSDSATMLSSGRELPSHKIRFTVTEAAPDKFNVGYLEGPFRVGMPFQVPLDFLDKYGNATKPLPDLKPELKASGLDLSYDNAAVKGNSLIIKGIVAKGVVESNSGKSFTLTVRIPGLHDDTQSLKIRLLPGPAHELQVLPDAKEQLVFENGGSPVFDLAVLDIAGNYTCEPKFVAVCKFHAPRQQGLPTYTVDLSNSCKGTLTGPPITLRQVTKDERIVAKFEVQNHKQLSGVERMLVVLPSHQAARISVSCLGENGERVELESGQDLSWVAGEPITHLKFEVHDEAGKKVTPTANMVAKMKPNWSSSYTKDQLLAGNLPDITCPSSVKQSLFCHISLSAGRTVDFSFTVKPRNGEPAILKVSCKGTTNVRIGQVHQADILIALTDKYQNSIKKLQMKDLAELLIIAEGLDYTDVLKALDQSGGFHVKGLKFLDTQLGAKEVCFQWKGLKDYLRLNVTPGPPVSISYLDYNANEPVTITPDGKMPQPLTVQLLDVRGNPSAEPNVKIQLGIDEGIKVIPPTPPVKTDSKGKASFGTFAVALKNNSPPKPCEFNICPTNCYGLFTLGTKASIGRAFINGPVLKLHLTCDPEKPVEVNVSYKGKQSLTVGEELAEIEVHVVAEDGNILYSARGRDLSMRVVRIGCSPKNQKVITFAPVEANASNGMYHFRKVKVPEVAGEYNVQFHFNNNKHSCCSSILSLTVVPDVPVKIAPQQNPVIPPVSNQSKQSTRSLLKYFKLDLTDRFGNTAGVNLSGTLTLQIVSPDPSVKEVPYFEGNVSSYQVPISKGCAIIQNLQIQENTQGVDGFQYLLRLTPSFVKSQLKNPIPHYEVPFLFYNDASKQEEMSRLTKKRTELLKQLQTFEDLFQTTENIYRELEAVIRDAQNEESKYRGELRRLGFNSNNVREEQHIGGALKTCEQQKQAMEVKNRRSYMPQAYPEEPGVLGKIGHLAWVEEDDVAAVLSWHMRGDIDCVVTETMEKAMEVYRKTGGRQQVVAVDSIYKRNLAKQLPHTRSRAFTPTGNPKFALDYFVFRKSPEICRTVFANFIGDTIVLDTLEDATRYRTEVTKFFACPTLLAKTGERVASTGKFGGQQNKAPSLHQLHGQVFGEPPVKDLDRIQEQMQLLKKLGGSMRKQKDARLELDKQKQKDTTFVLKKKDYEVLKKELSTIDDTIAKMSAYHQETEQRITSIPASPSLTQDAVRSSPRTVGRRVPASPKITPNDTGVNGIARRGRSGTPTTPPSDRKRRRLT